MTVILRVINNYYNYFYFLNNYNSAILMIKLGRILIDSSRLLLDESKWIKAQFHR